jgi:hypothetical protein
MTPLEIPVYLEAVQKERLIRDAAFLALPETVAGFELRQMTLRDSLVLTITRNPIMFKMTPDGLELATFLWFMSTDYTLDGRAMRKFLKRCRSFQKPAPPLFHTRRLLRRWEANVALKAGIWADTVAAVKEYIAETFQDRPGGKTVNGYSPSYYSDACFLCGGMARNYSRKFEDTMAMPLKQIWQFIAELKDSNGVTRASLGNPSDRVMADFCANLNRGAN